MSPPRRHTRLAAIISELGVYYGIRSKSSFINILIDKQTKPQDSSATQAAAIERLANETISHQLGEFFLSATEGAHSTKFLIDELTAAIPEEKTAAEIRGFIEVLFEPGFLRDANAFAKLPWAGSPDRWGSSGAFDFDDVDGPPPEPGPGDTPESHGTEAASMYFDGIPSLVKTIKEEKVYTQHTTSLTPQPPAGDEPAQWDEYADIDDVNANAESGESPVYSCFLINDPDLSPATKDSGAVSLFLSYIPTAEMSRCQVYLDVQIITHRAPVEGPDDKISTMSLAQFLRGRATTSADSDEAKITTMAVNASLLGNPEFERDDTAPSTADDPPNIASSGMELFTSPQTLVPADELWTSPDMSVISGDANPASTTDRSSQVIDRFRPLATLTGFSLSVTPTGGMMSHKTAEISLVLHDRSRLAEISDLIRPDMYGQTELLIEYGWSHPDAQNLAGEVSANPFAAFIDACRAKDKFKVKNSSFSFNDAGEVEVTIELFTSSAMAFNSSDISKGPGVGDKLKRFQELSGIIRHLRRQVSPPNEGGSSDVSGETWLASVTSPGGISNMDRQTKQAMRRWRRQQRQAIRDGTAGEATTELVSALDELLGTANGNTHGGVVASLTQSIENALALKEDLIKSPNSGDPWWEPILNDKCEFTLRNGRTEVSRHCKVRQHIADPRFATSKDWNRSLQRKAKAALGGNSVANRFARAFPKKYVSLGKLMSTYVIAPLLAEEKFDEIQVFYYTFNEYASYMCNRNISSFPIDFSEFKSHLNDATNETAFVPIRRFLGILQSKFISKSHNPAYGMSNLYQSDGEGGMKLKANYEDNPTALDGEKQKRLRQAYTGDPNTRPEQRLKFKKPRLAMSTEVVSAMNDNPGLTASQQTILKIHIYDKACSPHSTMQDLLKASRRGSMGTLNTLARNVIRESGSSAAAQQRRATNAAQLQTAMTTANIIEEVPGSSPPAWKIAGGFSAIKNFIRGSMPSIVYGAQYSGVISASVSSMNDPQLSTIHMMRSGQPTARTPAGQANAGLPLRVSPVEVSVTIFGCPMVNFGQQFFIDFGTGTTVDNVYAVTGISHSLSQGEFTTELKLVQLDAYGAYESSLDLVSQAHSVATEAAG